MDAKQRLSNFSDWSNSASDLSAAGFAELDMMNAKFRKFSEEELKPQPTIKKSKKVRGPP